MHLSHACADPSRQVVMVMAVPCSPPEIDCSSVLVQYDRTSRHFVLIMHERAGQCCALTFVVSMPVWAHFSYTSASGVSRSK